MTAVEHGELPAGLEQTRVTDEFDADTVPAGLLRAHRVADGMWGVVRVRSGSVRFVWEDGPPTAGPLEVELSEGDSLVIPPAVPHRVEVGAGGRFVVEFHR